jgi:diguanylate cyclase (GGDEF)-like protein
MLVAVKDARAPYIASYLRAMHLLLDENKPEAARTVMVEETTPALFNYHNAWDQFPQFQMEEMDKQVRVMAYYDALTGLPNRTLLQDRISVALASALRRHEKVALLFLDLDQFKTINDSLGHSVGDLLLKGFAERLKQGTREQDTVARLAGDEFVVLLATVKEAGDAAVAAQRIVDSMAAGFVIHERLLNVTCSIGISISPDDCTAAEALMRNADIAMYCAKQSGRNMFQFFTKDMNAQAMERLSLENSLRGALQRKEFFLAYQPQVDITTGRITGVEALLRWHHPELGRSTR